MKKNSNKRSSKKGLVPALLATLCSVGALTSVSYAWFTMGNTASVGDIDVNVQAADGMQISADASSWKSILPVDELKTANPNGFPTELAPVSTDGTVENGVHSMFAGEIINEKVETKATTEGYIVFDLYIKLDADKVLSLDEGSFVIDQANNDKDSSLASRVSFVNEGVVTDGKPSSAQALKDGSEVAIWEPNADIHNATNTNNGVEGKKAYEGVKSVIDLDEQGNYIPTQTAGANTPEDDQDDVFTTYESHFSSVTTLAPAATDYLTTAEQELLNLKKGINKVKIYIWLEGQDVDCTNEVAGGAISVGLKFSVPEEPQNP